MPDTTTDTGPPPGREPLTTDDVAKVAKLALLELDDDELQRFTGQLDAVLDLAGRLAEFDMEGVPPTSHPFGLTNVLRPDVPAEVTAEDAAAVRAEALAAGPEVEDDRFKVPPALGEAP